MPVAFPSKKVLVPCLLGVTIAVPLVAACGKRAEKRPWTLAECNDEARRAEAEVGTWAATLDVACREHADCTSESREACGHWLACDGIVPLAKTALPAFTAQRGQITAARCKRMEEADCTRIFGPPPVSSCSPPKPACIRGRCVLTPNDVFR